MKTTLAKPDLKAIRARVDARSYERGEAYFRRGAIFDGRRQGATIKARCEGSQGGPYRVEATIGPKGAITQADCSCPVGDGGRCKHVAALLLTWRARPEEFAEVEEVDASLERRSKPELIALIKQMLRRAPDLEVLLETPLPAGRKKGAAVSPDVFRRQAARALRDADPYDDWDSGPNVEDALRPIVEIGDGFLEGKDHVAASAVYEGVLTALEEAEDVGGGDDTMAVADDALGGLGECLPHLEDEARRIAVLRAMVEALPWAGNADVAGLIADHATAAERAAVVGWANEAMAAAPTYSKSRWARFLLDVQGDAVDDAVYLNTCRDAGLYDEMVVRLLERGRVDEAVAVVQGVESHRVLALAHRLVEHGQAARAEAIVRERAKGEKYDTTFLRWLKDRAAARRDRAEVRRLAEALFDRQASFESYKDVRQSADKAAWPELRARLLDRLEEAGNRQTLIRIYLDEKDVDSALAALAREKPSRFGYGFGHGAPLDLEVAQAAEATRPEAALEVYRKHAERLIEARGRENYKAASDVLKKVRALYERLGRRDGWAYELGVIREKYRSLSALKDEMTKAKLL